MDNEYYECIDYNKYIELLHKIADDLQSYSNDLQSYKEKLQAEKLQTKKKYLT